MSDDISKEFTEYRDAAMASTTSRLDHPTFGFTEQFRELVAARWPEAAAARDTLRMREIGHGHQNGALCELLYEVGSEALGWRRFMHDWVDDATGWRWRVVKKMWSWCGCALSETADCPKPWCVNGAVAREALARDALDQDPGLVVPIHDIGEQGGTRLECPSCAVSDFPGLWGRPFDWTGPEPINRCWSCGYEWRWLVR